jgi:hypothetical protein
MKVLLNKEIRLACGGALCQGFDINGRTLVFSPDETKKECKYLTCTLKQGFSYTFDEKKYFCSSESFSSVSEDIIELPGYEAK